MDINQHSSRGISPKTIENFKRAKSHEILGPGNSVIHVNLWCEKFYFLPSRHTEYSVTWWELETTAHRKVNITRYYWLKFGMAIIRPTY